METNERKCESKNTCCDIPLVMNAVVYSTLESAISPPSDHLVNILRRETAHETMRLESRATLESRNRGRDSFTSG